ncbi:unnamed protein product [Kuraishia capsulata CBS 1993]|uniref:Uncharacterized protein n=1 Tax=Kuraishia capsulata CBS 1993 TaxID=1382522 RepID=W6MHX4_9ASCO|nr:uncharacterized protein KUCA_T00001930001 [Kuraishia capsulata CBS 1993]CDK25959.1 unnamed protein product [Kuraishia capsulata CBS 1993]
MRDACGNNSALARFLRFYPSYMNVGRHKQRGKPFCRSHMVRVDLNTQCGQIMAGYHAHPTGNSATPIASRVTAIACRVRIRHHGRPEGWHETWGPPTIESPIVSSPRLVVADLTKDLI